VEKLHYIRGGITCPTTAARCGSLTGGEIALLSATDTIKREYIPLLAKYQCSPRCMRSTFPPKAPELAGMGPRIRPGNTAAEPRSPSPRIWAIGFSTPYPPTPGIVPLISCIAGHYWGAPQNTRPRHHRSAFPDSRGGLMPSAEPLQQCPRRV